MENRARRLVSLYVGEYRTNTFQYDLRIYFPVQHKLKALAHGCRKTRGNKKTGEKKEVLIPPSLGIISFAK